MTRTIKEYYVTQNKDIWVPPYSVILGVGRENYVAVLQDEGANPTERVGIKLLQDDKTFEAEGLLYIGSSLKSHYYFVDSLTLPETIEVHGS